MFRGTLLEPLRIETVNELGELCEVYIPRKIIITVDIKEEDNIGLDMDKPIREAVEKIKRDEEIESLLGG